MKQPLIVALIAAFVGAVITWALPKYFAATPNLYWLDISSASVPGELTPDDLSIEVSVLDIVNEGSRSAQDVRLRFSFGDIVARVYPNVGVSLSKDGDETVVTIHSIPARDRVRATIFSSISSDPISLVFNGDILEKVNFEVVPWDSYFAIRYILFWIVLIGLAYIAFRVAVRFGWIVIK